MQAAVTEQDAMFKLSWLSLEKSQFSLHKQNIDCCKGDSGYFDVDTNVYVHCPLNARWQVLQVLLEKSKKNSPELSWLKIWNHQQLLSTLPTLKKIIYSYEKNRSVVIESTSSSSLMLLLAIEAIWLYGCDAVLIDFSYAKRVQSFYQELDYLTANKADCRPIVILSQIKKLWDSQNATDFEGMLSFCYQHGFVVWVEFVNEGISPSVAKVGASDARRSKRLLDRVEQIRTNSFYNWLTSSCRSQLSEMTGEAKYLKISEMRTRSTNKENQFLKEV